MNSFYQQLFRLSVLHAYYASGRLQHMTVVPAAATAQLMQQWGLLFRPMPGGCTLWYDRLFAGTERSPEALQACTEPLRFYLLSSDAYLLNCTAGLSAFRSGTSMLYFSNLQPGIEKGVLHAAEYAGDADIVAAGDERLPGTYQAPFATVDVSLPRLDTGSLEIRFAAKATYWRYVLVADYLQALEQPAILHRTNKTPFCGPVPLLLPNGVRALSFVSTAPVALSEQPNRNFQLVEQYNPGNGKYRMVIQALPNPSIQSVSAIDATMDTATRSAYSEIIV